MLSYGCQRDKWHPMMIIITRCRCSKMTDEAADGQHCWLSPPTLGAEQQSPSEEVYLKCKLRDLAVSTSKPLRRSTAKPLIPLSQVGEICVTCASGGLCGALSTACKDADGAVHELSFDFSVARPNDSFQNLGGGAGRWCRIRFRVDGINNVVMIDYCKVRATCRELSHAYLSNMWHCRVLSEDLKYNAILRSSDQWSRGEGGVLSKSFRHVGTISHIVGYN
mmetsp:Transcript_10308/g.23239  ORF Transcript_10308/g.23239 Transcript_10308/m.23239 type:complete len:222 (+) Transcript_10308:55-720(+)